jgi:signal transduction histidine kinase
MLALTLIVFGLVVAGVTFGLRNEVRSQILHRESEALYSATILQRDLLEESDEALGLEEDDYALFSIVMRTSRMRGVVAMRVFDSKGIFFDSVPVEVIDDDLTKGDLDRLASTGPEARFHEAYPFDELFIGGIGKPAATAPLLQVLLPLSHREETSGVGIAELWVDGQGVKAEFDRLDASLFRQAGLAFGAGSLLTLLGLGWAFRRLERSNRLLTKRTSELARANADLALAAKTSAIGTVTSHLIHGLKNPLAGLESLVGPTGSGSITGDNAGDLREAASAARRMRSIVDEVVTILREEKSGTRYELPVREVLEMVSDRVLNRADSRGVSFVHRGGEKGSLSNREANLVGLILVNLIENAIDASEAGQEVRLEALVYEREIEFLVEDDGPGLPDGVKRNIFQPVKSEKEGGSGIGLALSHQLAVSLGGRLELEESVGRPGARFKLAIPVAVVIP